MTDTRTATNPLIDFSGLPRFSDFHPEDVTPAIDTLLAQHGGTTT